MPYELIPMFCAAFGFFSGVTLAGSMAIHSGEILYNQINGLNPGMYTRAPGAPRATVLGFTYDFRFTRCNSSEAR